MPYAQRDAEGHLTALLAEASEKASEFLPPEHPEVLAFLNAGEEGGAEPRLAAYDAKMIRVIEDLIDLLIDKNVITFTELPQAAQEKILQQKNRREKMFGVSDLLSPESDIL